MLIASSIEDHARDLLGCLNEKRQNGIANRPLVFVAHSLGGHVVKQVTILDAIPYIITNFC